MCTSQLLDPSSCPCDKQLWLCRSLGLQSTALPSSFSSYPSIIPSFFLVSSLSVFIEFKGFGDGLNLKVLICSITGVQPVLLIYFLFLCFCLFTFQSQFLLAILCFLLLFPCFPFSLSSHRVLTVFPALYHPPLPQSNPELYIQWCFDTPLSPDLALL